MNNENATSPVEVRRAAARVAGLFAHGATPTEAEVAAARFNLAATKLERAIRTGAEQAPMPDPVRLGYMVGLLTTWCASDDRELMVEGVRRAVGQAVYCAGDALTDADRADLVRLVLDGGAA